MSISNSLRTYSQRTAWKSVFSEFLASYLLSGLVIGAVILSGAMRPVMSLTNEYPILLNTGGIVEAVDHGLWVPILFLPIAFAVLHAGRHRITVGSIDLAPVAAWFASFVIFVSAVLVLTQLREPSVLGWNAYLPAAAEFTIEFGIPAALVTASAVVVDGYCREE